MENYKVSYLSKAGVLEVQYQEVLGAALSTAPGSPRLWQPKAKYQSKMTKMAFFNYMKAN